MINSQQDHHRNHRTVTIKTHILLIKMGTKLFKKKGINIDLRTKQRELEETSKTHSNFFPLLSKNNPKLVLARSQSVVKGDDVPVVYNILRFQV